MTCFTTNLVEELKSSGFDLDEFFRKQLEEAMNQLLADELTAFLGYQAHSYERHRSGNSRNGYYDRHFDTKYDRIHLSIPRNRLGEFKQSLLPEYSRRTENLEDLVIRLY